MYAWNVTNCNILSQSANEIQVVCNQIGKQIITLTITPEPPCVPVTMGREIAFHKPIAKIVKAFESEEICRDKKVTLKSLHNDAYDIVWSPIGLFANNAQEVSANLKASVLVTLTVTDTFNCSDEDTMQLNVENCCQVYMPNVFSPNGDGKNDTYKPSLGYDVQLVRFAIYNQWGEKIFITSDKDKAWDGYYKGQPVELDTYYYILEYNCEGKVSFLKNDFLLVR
jgi:gliding motility-associated-like protein